MAALAMATIANRMTAGQALFGAKISTATMPTTATPDTTSHVRWSGLLGALKSFLAMTGKCPIGAKKRGARAAISLAYPTSHTEHGRADSSGAAKGRNGGMRRNDDRDLSLPEEDTPRDPQQALSRATGGVPDPDAVDQASTTGTTPKGVYVGRIAGDDVGFAGETGAERRAQAAEAARREQVTERAAGSEDAP